jgi:hypothetical protein
MSARHDAIVKLETAGREKNCQGITQYMRSVDQRPADVMKA